jgi:hypothetical protein
MRAAPAPRQLDEARPAGIILHRKGWEFGWRGLDPGLDSRLLGTLAAPLAFPTLLALLLPGLAALGLAVAPLAGVQSGLVPRWLCVLRRSKPRTGGQAGIDRLVCPDETGRQRKQQRKREQEQTSATHWQKPLGTGFGSPNQHCERMHRAL